MIKVFLVELAISAGEGMCVSTARLFEIALNVYTNLLKFYNDYSFLANRYKQRFSFIISPDIN